MNADNISDTSCEPIILDEKIQIGTNTTTFTNQLNDDLTGFIEPKEVITKDLIELNKSEPKVPTNQSTGELIESNEPKVQTNQSTGELVESDEPKVQTNQSTGELIESDEPKEVPIGFRAHEKTLAVPEEVVVYLNELNAASMITNAKIDAYSKNSMMRFINGNIAIVDIPDPNEQTNDNKPKEITLFTSDEWYLIGEFRINEMDEEGVPKDIEFVWGWGLRPEDPRTKPITKVVEELPYGLQPLTFPLVKFEDIGLIEIIKAYSFHTMELEYIMTKWSEQLQSWGIFGVRNIQWSELKKPLSPEWEKILTIVREIVAKKKIADSTLEHKVAVEAAWKEPEVLSLVAEYRRVKDAAYQQRLELTEKIRQAMLNPAAIVNQMMASENNTEPTPETTPESNSETNSETTQELNGAMQAVERAFAKVEEAELANMDAVGDDFE
jgi:hypothetical protein